MSGTVAKQTRAGRTRQQAADAAVAGTAPRCDEQRTHGASTFTCVRPPHGGNHPYTDAWRRDRGQSVNADHHVFVKEGS